MTKEKYQNLLATVEYYANTILDEGDEIFALQNKLDMQNIVADDDLNVKRVENKIGMCEENVRLLLARNIMNIDKVFYHCLTHKLDMPYPQKELLIRLRNHCEKGEEMESFFSDYFEDLSNLIDEFGMEEFNA